MKLRIANCALGIEETHKDDCALRIANGRGTQSHRLRLASQGMNPTEMKGRTKRFALNVIILTEDLPKSRTTEVLGRQLLRSGTSVGANYRSACSARSTAEFIAKMGIVEEELEETIYWIELLIESGHLSPDQAEDLIREAKELLAITVASIRTAKRKK